MMPSRKRTGIQVWLNDHAEDRWIERVGRPPGALKKLLIIKLREQLRCGLTIHHGRALIPLDKEDLDLPVNLIACLDLPDYRGIWRVITFKEVITS